MRHRGRDERMLKRAEMGMLTRRRMVTGRIQDNSHGQNTGKWSWIGHRIMMRRTVMGSAQSNR